VLPGVKDGSEADAEAVKPGAATAASVPEAAPPGAAAAAVHTGEAE